MRQWLLLETKAFVLLVVATSFLEIWPTDQQFEVIELYAGAARITRLARAIGLSAWQCWFSAPLNGFGIDKYVGFTLLFVSPKMAPVKTEWRIYCDTTLGIYLGLQFIAFYIRSMTTSPWPWVFSAQHLFR